jgi:hypothetical protein
MTSFLDFTPVVGVAAGLYVQQKHNKKETTKQIVSTVNLNF